MIDSPDDVEGEEIAAAEAFAILGNETRMAILRRLAGSEGPCSFSDIRRDVAPDDTGNFSYHLNRLTDQFVRKTDEGYVLRFAGALVVRAVRTGAITDDTSVPPSEIDERCVYCGATVEMSYEEEVISVRCTDCGGVGGSDLPDGAYMQYEFPPAGLAGRTREAAVDAAHVLYDAKVTPMMKGTCPECAGRVAVSHDVCDSHDVGESGLCPNCGWRYEVWSTYECEHCQYTRRAAMWFATLIHPAVVAFCHDHGLEETIPIRKLTWDNSRFVGDVTGSVVETDPYRFEVRLPVEDEVLLVSLDETLDVLATERTKRGDA